MDNDFDLRDFPRETRLFPLPQVVMFPHVVLPLHIFEPRYRQMTEDALVGDRLVTIVQISPAAKGKLHIEPTPLEEVGCLGRIIQHERLADGRFNFLLLGRKRVRIKQELPRGKLYRVAEVEILEDIEPELAAEDLRSELIAQFREVLRRRRPLDPDLESLLENPVPLCVLTDIIAHALHIPPGLKQWLLAETDVQKRADTLGGLLRQLATIETGRPFPPPFSVN